MRYSFGNLPVSHKFALFNRNRKGKIVKPAPFQKSAVPGEVARVAPNRNGLVSTIIILDQQNGTVYQ